MNIVFFGYDYTLDIAQRLIADGHNIVQIYTFPCDNHFAFNRDIQDYASFKGIRITDEKVQKEQIDALVENGADLFLCAGYPYKIPPIDQKKAYGLNVHPALLPRGRGVMPLPFIIMQDQKAAGATIHKLSDSFDAGDILWQEAIPIDDKADVETLSAKIAVKCPEAVSHVVANLPELWSTATPQAHEKQTTYPAPDDQMRTLIWDSPAAEVDAMGRAFGRYGTIAHIENNAGQSQSLAVFNLSAWQEVHNHASGTLLRSSDREVIICVQDGYACLKEFQVLPT